MRLLVITLAEERAQEFVGSMWEEQVPIEYYPPEGPGWLERLRKGHEGKEHFSAILVYSLGEQYLSGIVRGLRQTLPLPLIVCSEKCNYYEELQCLQAGADDYVSTTIHTSILRLRTLHLIQLYQGCFPQRLVYGGLTESPGNRQYYYDQHSLELTGREYDVLYWIFRSYEEIVSKEKLLYHIWEEDTPQTRRALDTVMKQLRRKLQDTPVRVKTCYGKGYRLENTQ